MISPFDMIVARLNEEPESTLDWGTHMAIESMIQVALVYDKNQWLKRLEACITEEDGQALIAELYEYMPVMGYHSWPHGQGEDLGKAIRYQADKDDFYERDTTSGIR
jgi:hypothetical protein